MSSRVLMYTLCFIWLMISTGLVIVGILSYIPYFQPNLHEHWFLFVLGLILNPKDYILRSYLKDLHGNDDK